MRRDPIAIEVHERDRPETTVLWQTLQAHGSTFRRALEDGSRGGILKPGVVFFGELVPRDRVTPALDGVTQGDGLLVVGTSLMVYSGYQFAEAATAAGKPIAAVHLDLTRADHLLALKIKEPCDAALSAVAEASPS